MKRLRKAPSGATKPARVPAADRALRQSGERPRAFPDSSPHPDEGPAPQVAGASPSAPTRAAAPLEPQGSTPSPFFLDTVTGARAWHAAATEALLDLASLAREGARRPRRRVLSRAEIRRGAREAYGQLRDLLGLAARHGGAHAR
jgi:hypothetical protein